MKNIFSPSNIIEQDMYQMLIGYYSNSKVLEYDGVEVHELLK